jgi:aminoglycoside phosphotransferase (APT) family kinase protein
MTDGLSAELRGWVASEAGDDVVSCEPIGQGASRQIWLVVLSSGRDLVVRLDVGDGPVTGTPLTLAREAAVYRCLAESGLPMPRLHAVHADGNALLLDRAPGSDRLTDLPDRERGEVAEDYGRCVGRLHAIETGTLDLGPLAPPGGADPTSADIDLWRSIDATRSGAAASGAVRIALDLLGSNVPGRGHTSLCHGDAGPGNFLHERGRVTALLDWEFAHVGDPHDDLAWVAVRNQLLRHPLDIGVTFAAWRHTTGIEVDLRRVEWFRALVLTRMLISCDATIAWAGPDAPGARVQVVLRPFLAVAVFEALRRAGYAPEAPDAEHDARTAWEGSVAADALDDPRHLDDLGALL